MPQRSHYGRPPDPWDACPHSRCVEQTQQEASFDRRVDARSSACCALTAGAISPPDARAARGGCRGRRLLAPPQLVRARARRLLARGVACLRRVGQPQRRRRPVVASRRGTRSHGAAGYRHGTTVVSERPTQLRRTSRQAPRRPHGDRGVDRARMDAQLDLCRAVRRGVAHLAGAESDRCPEGRSRRGLHAECRRDRDCHDRNHGHRRRVDVMFAGLRTQGCARSVRAGGAEGVVHHRRLSLRRPRDRDAAARNRSVRRTAQRGDADRRPLRESRAVPARHRQRGRVA